MECSAEAQNCVEIHGKVLPAKINADDSNQPARNPYSTICLLLFIMVLFGWYRWYGILRADQERLRRPIMTGPIRTEISINTANASQLSLLPGVGPKLANAIINYRSQNGPITSWEQLESIRGIGPKMIVRMQQYGVIK
jgi:competence ComEA-like helix-hairpin-helix protein